VQNQAVPKSFHELCEADEQTLRDAAARDIPEASYLDRAGDELFRVAQAAKTAGPPAGAPHGWGAASNGVLAAAAMSLRTGRAIGLLVRSGYGFEAAGLVRRLGEVTQHAASCAQDPTGTYARNWGEGAGSAGKPSKAYMHGVTEPNAVRDKWGFLSQMGHANLRPYLNFMCALDEQGEVFHPVEPARHEAVDAIVLSSTAWDLVRTAGAVCKAHPHVDNGPTLALAQELQAHQAASDARADAWATARHEQMRPDADTADGGDGSTDDASR
jgi:hypothetical protein